MLHACSFFEYVATEHLKMLKQQILPIDVSELDRMFRSNSL